MRAVFRVDASRDIGVGHVMRCLALAEALRPRATIEFVCRRLAGDLCDEIEQRGYRVHRLQEGDRAGSSTADAAETLASMRSDRSATPDWLVVDHYGIDAAWHAALRPHVARILAIDDLANRKLDCDLLLDQNLDPVGEQRYATLVPAGCGMLAGPRYALLREEFRGLRRAIRLRTAVSRVLVSFGGADTANFAERAIEALSLPLLSGLSADVVIGPSNPHGARIRELCAKRSAMRPIDDHRRLATLMAENDLAVGAAGSSLWERACLGLPSIAVAVAPNQEYVARRAAQEGIAVVLPPSDFDAASLAVAIARVAAAPEELQAMSRRCEALVDGDGALRVAAALCRGPVRLRNAVAADIDRVYEWRNSDPVRHASHDSRPIGRTEHREWFLSSLASGRRDLLVAEVDGGPMGVLRYDVEGRRAMVSIYLRPDWIGRGYGADVLQAGHAWLAAHRPEVAEAHAEMLEDNRTSMSTFLKAGFRGDSRRMVWSAPK